MSTQHTPGPWWTTDHGVRDSGGYIFHTNSVQRYEGQDERYAFEVAQREADKRLGAAAPDLLNALQYIVGCSVPMTRQQEECWPVMCAAIAKATGQKGGA